MVITKDLGAVSAYAYAVEQGYQGTEEEFAELMARQATVAEEAAASADAAAESASEAQASAEQAEQSAQSISGDVERAEQAATTATGKATEAATSATTANGAAQTATGKAAQAEQSATAAANSASAAATSASNAASSATAAQTAQTAAETAQGKAEDAQAAAEAAAASIDPDTLVKKTELEDYAKIDGSYETMTVGNAEQLVATVGVDDNSPYNFRTSGGSVDIGDRETVNAVVGGTVAWNQMLIDPSNFANNTDTAKWRPHNVSNGSLSFASDELTYTVTTVGNTAWGNGINCPDFYKTQGHVLLLAYKIYVPKPCKVAKSYYQGYVPADAVAGWNDIATIQKTLTSGNSYNIFGVSNLTDAGYVVGDTYKIKYPMIIDLTILFGSSIADYIYSLEQASAGAGVAWFKKLFPKPYYAYNAGELLSVNTSRHKMVGFNAMNGNITVGHWWSNGELKTNRTANYAAFDEKIKVVPNQTYCFAVPNITARATGFAFYYDENGNFLDGQNSTGNPQPSVAYMTFTVPSNAHYITVALYRYETVMTAAEVADACINLSWDGERDGEYEPYKEWVYPLDSSLTLRGIPKLDASGNLYYDGDTYAPDGTVTRRYGVVDLGTLNWATYGSTSDYDRYVTNGIDSLAKAIRDCLCSAFACKAQSQDAVANNVWVGGGSARLAVTTSKGAYSNVSAFKTAMSGVMLVYELATPTTETAETYTQIQTVDDFGTEEYTDYAYENGDRDVAIPVGHNTVYSPNLRAKLEMSPNSPDGDGLYVVEQSNGQNEYVPLVIPTELPPAPSEDGTYTLKITVSGGTVTKSWIAEE